MTKKEQRQYLKTVERMRAKLERKYAPKVLEALQSIKSSFITAVQTGGPQAANALAPDVWNDQLMKVYAEMFTESHNTFAKFTYRQVPKQENGRKSAILNMEHKLRGGMGVAEEFLLAVQTWLRQYGLQMVSTINGNSRDLYLRIVNDAIQEGIDKGLGQSDIAQMIVNRLNDEGYTYEKFRALRISRTETARAANVGHMNGAGALPFLVNKVWISAKDNRTRRIPEDEWDHWNLDGEVIDLNNPYMAVSKKGVAIEVQQPGDINAPAGFTINCRCRVAFIGKRDQNGSLIMK